MDECTSHTHTHTHTHTHKFVYVWKVLSLCVDLVFILQFYVSIYSENICTCGLETIQQDKALNKVMPSNTERNNPNRPLASYPQIFPHMLS